MSIHAADALMGIFGFKRVTDDETTLDNPPSLDYYGGSLNEGMEMYEVKNEGLEVVGWYRMDDRKAITPYPSVCATWHKMGAKVGAAYSDSAQAIIDGLRGEVGAQRVKTFTALKERNDARAERDQQAQRIGELEGLLRHAQKQVPTGSGLHMRIDAALSAGKKRVG